MAMCALIGWHCQIETNLRVWRVYIDRSSFMREVFCQHGFSFIQSLFSQLFYVVLSYLQSTEKVLKADLH